MFGEVPTIWSMAVSVLQVGVDIGPACCGLAGYVDYEHAGFYRFSLDSGANQTDNYSVDKLVDLTSSPLDTPKGLRRGYLFIGEPRGGMHAC